MSNQDQVIWRSDLPRLAGVSTQTVSRWARQNRLPKADVHITQKTYGWRLSTLREAGIAIK